MRYSRNMGAITPKEQERLKNSRVVIVGCGGLGGNLLVYLARIGVGHITVADPDVFEESNLNRQMFATELTLGQKKVRAAAEAVRSINPEVEITCYEEVFTVEKGMEWGKNQDLLIDAVDNIAARRDMARVCEALEIPMIYGAVRGWNLQVSVFPPQKAVQKLQLLYPKDTIPEDKSSLSFVVSACASIQSAEAVKRLLDKESELDGQLLFGDLLNGEWETLPL